MNSILVTTGILISVLSKTNQTQSIFKEDKNFFYEKDNLLVLGNQDELVLDLALNSNKSILIYDLNKTLDEEHNMIYKNVLENKTYYLSTTSSTNDEKLDEFKEYFGDVYQTPKRRVKKAASSSESIFKTVKTKSFRQYNKPYGYFNYDFTLKRYDFSDLSSLYLVTVKQGLVSGYVANHLDLKGYNDYYFHDAYTKISAIQSKTEVGYGDIRYGGVPVYKDAYPVNSPKSVTLTSSYTVSSTTGASATIGASMADGLYVEGTVYGELTLTEQFTKQYGDTNPSLSTQLTSTKNKYSWYYRYSTHMNESNNQNLGYLFEMNNRQDGRDVKNDVIIKITGKMVMSSYDTCAKKEERQTITFQKDIL